MPHLGEGDRSADAIVLLHGMGTGASAWQPQIDALSERYYVLAPFLPGYGDNPGPFSMRSARDQVASVLSERSRPPSHLCGLSLGALVALEVARSHSHLVRSLILSAGFVALPSEYKAPSQASSDAIRNMDQATLGQEVLPGLVRDVPAPYKDEALREILGLTPADLAELISFEFDATDWIDQITVSTLVLCGDRDEVNLPLSRELAERLPHARFELVAEAGHVANLDAPDAFTGAVTRFIEELGTVAPHD